MHRFPTLPRGATAWIVAVAVLLVVAIALVAASAFVSVTDDVGTAAAAEPDFLAAQATDWGRRPARTAER